MKEATNIITIRKNDKSRAHQEFVKLMRKTQDLLNAEALDYPQRYKKISATDLEKVSADTVKIACNNTPFRPEEICLISGHAFPDIVAEQYYGIEVKSTKQDHWVSTGSSIMESTRVKNVEDIYMLFGKLGGKPEFKCRPYQDVLYDIAVTHSPRYLINMNITDEETIFSKMGTSYDVFRQSKDSIDQVRRYYKDKAIKENVQAMPWWITSDNVESSQSFMIRLWSALSIDEKENLISKSMVLFPETLNPPSSPRKYNRVTLWLCSYCQIVMPNIRDVFSAGGKITKVNGRRIANPAPKVFSKIVQYAPMIAKMLRKPTKELLSLIEDYNSDLLDYDNLFDGWVDMVVEIAKPYKVPIIKWIEDQPEFSYS